MIRRTIPVLFATLALAACDKGEEATPRVKEVEVPVPVVQSAAAEKPAPVAAAAPEKVLGDEPSTSVPDSEIPTEEDFEAEADKLISAENLDDALDELERQIEQS